MAVTPGAPVAPEDLLDQVLGDVTVELLRAAPPSSATSLAVDFNEDYGIYADNAGAGTAANRFWVAGPNGGEFIVGPRSGASFFGSIRLRTDATTASAANCFIDASSQQIRRSTSSLKYKVDVKAAKVDAEQVLGLRPVTFRDRAEAEQHGAATRRYLGLIAEEVHDLGLTQLIQYAPEDPEDPDSPQRPDGVQYDRLPVLLLSIVRDQAAQIADLTARVERLESK